MHVRLPRGPGPGPGRPGTRARRPVSQEISSHAKIERPDFLGKLSQYAQIFCHCKKKFDQSFSGLWNTETFKNMLTALLAFKTLT